jgi:hypothetical protein
MCSVHGCQGDFWKENSTTGEWEGDPVFDLSYSAYHKLLKKEYHRTNESAHSLPMLPKDLRGMFERMDHQLMLGNITKTQALFWKAYATISFTLWTRYAMLAASQFGCPFFSVY